MPDRYKLLGQFPVKLKETDLPSNIIWENLEYNQKSRRIRKVIFVCLITAAILLTTAIVISASYYNSVVQNRNNVQEQLNAERGFECTDSIFNMVEDDPDYVNGEKHLLFCLCERILS